MEPGPAAKGLSQPEREEERGIRGAARGPEPLPGMGLPASVHPAVAQETGREGHRQPAPTAIHQPQAGPGQSR